MTDVLGVLVIACNSDCDEFYQNPKTYEPQSAKSAPLGTVKSFWLGSFLHLVCLNPSSLSYITNMKTDLVNTHAVDFYAKAGGEGPIIFDSAITLLQGSSLLLPKTKSPLPMRPLLSPHLVDTNTSPLRPSSQAMTTPSNPGQTALYIHAF
ncbi:hypothetical protein EDC04DRAFT_2891182 [Pisolithus marmoratus]|nr:hypothetical protein EDC04DRAFT_2891182 [Pisolithus marmoratus]